MSYGANVDWLVPENLTFNLTDVRSALLRRATPSLMESLEKKVGRFDISYPEPESWVKLDVMTRSLAAEIIREHKPNFMLMHFLSTDEERHGYGPDSPQSPACLWDG